MPQKPTLIDYLHLHFVVLIWGFTAILGLLADSISALGPGYPTHLLGGSGAWAFSC